MNDRFKFRVWSEEDCGYMESIDIFRLTHGGKVVFNNDSLNREPECNPKRYICEQCTGLKDKNGKLIYEGDILKISSNTDREVVSPVVWDDEETGFCVKYKEELFRFNTYREYHKLEVIGNIHENPELLKEE